MKNDHKLISLIYTLFLGVIIALFVGYGISAFYAAPASPEYPKQHEVNGGQTKEKETIWAKYDAEMDSHRQRDKIYRRNVSIIALSVAVVLVGISLATTKKMRIMADGVMIGALLLLLYAIVSGIFSQSRKYTFIATAAGLLIVIILGYYRFVRLEKPIN